MGLGLDCDLLSTFHANSTSHSISNATLFWWWLEQRSTKHPSILQSTTRVLFRTTKYNKKLQITWKCYPALVRLIVVTHETSSTSRRATSGMQNAGTTTFMFDSRDTWNVIDLARSNRSRLQTPPNTAPATTNDSHDWPLSHLKRPIHDEITQKRYYTILRKHNALVQCGANGHETP